MKKKFIITLILVLVLCFCLTACGETLPYGKEMLTNGNFEADTGDTINKITGWTRQSNNSSVRYQFGKDKSQYLLINNHATTLSNLYQTVAVEKGATYKVSATFRINNKINSGAGFGIGFLEDMDFFPVHHTAETNGWETYELYFTPNMTEVNLCVRLVGQGAGVSVDNVSMTKVDASLVPAGTTIHTLNTKVEMPYNKTAGGITLSVFMILLTAIIFGIAYFALRRVAVDNNFLPNKDNEKVNLFKKLSLTPMAIISITMVIGFVIRFILALTMYGYDPNYNSEASVIATLGISAYYYTNNTVTPFGYLYYLALYGLLRNAASINGYMGISIMLKLPSILADLGIIYLIYTFGRKYVGDKNAGIFSLLYAILPPVFMLNAGWGGTESLAILFALSIFICIVEKRNFWLIVCSLLGVLFSYEIVYILPLVLCYAVMQCIKRKTDKKFIIKAVAGVFSFFVGFYLLTLPMTYGYVAIGYPMFVFQRVYDIMAADALACLNNFNLFAIIGLNGQVASNATFIISIVVVMSVWAYSIYLYVAKRNRLNLLLAGAFTMLSVNTFAVNQNNAMAVIGVVLLMMYAMLSRDKRIYFITGGIFTLNAMNIYSLVDMAGYIGGEIDRYELYNKFDWVQVLGSVLMVILVIALMIVAYDIAVGEKRKEVQPIYYHEIEEFKVKVAKKFKIKKVKSE